MGRALVRDPKVFLFDEPLSNRVPPKEAPNAGEVAEFTVDMARACLFDPKTEQRAG